MPKSVTSKTKKDKKYITLDTAQSSSEVAESVSRVLFDTEFKKIRDDLEKQETKTFQIMIGAVVAAFLIVVGLIWGAWAFIGEYNQHYLDAEKSFSTQLNEIRKENLELKETLMREVGEITAKQEYIERNILERATVR